MKTALEDYRAALEEIRASGTYKEERIITTPQRSRIDTTAAWLQVPYLLWVFFAGYLNLGVYLLNR